MAKTKSSAHGVSAHEYVSRRVGPGKRKVTATEAAALAAVYDNFREAVLDEEIEGKKKAKKPGSHAA